MQSREIRQKFLDFFESKGHKIVPSAPMVIKNDPTLMFTNAGMNQFKDYFLGNKEVKSPRVADTQKCLRVSGKHNDLEEVGIDTYHHTMFEMLGNWSFGDYFKGDAIAWAWELLTRVYDLPEDRLYVTVFGGDKKDRLDLDQEAYDYWEKWIPKAKILYGDKKDNFWEMGETGPCGPCSEIHIDLRPDDQRQQVAGHKLVNQDHPLVVEVWNLVFIQFNRTSKGNLEPLPSMHVDTGMGLERLAMAIQNKESNYETDVFQSLIGFLEAEASVTYGKTEEIDIALRVCADHIRAVSFAIADGQLPSNTGAGYVIRRILRRALRYGYTYLGFEKPFLYTLVPILVKQFEDVFPELGKQQDHISKVIEEEEKSFLKTLEKGLKMIDHALSNREEIEKVKVTGDIIFKLYDTYGFPKDLTLLILRERGFEHLVHKNWEKQFNKSLEQQVNRSKADANVQMGDWIHVTDDNEVDFIGYDQLECKSQITRYRTLQEKGKSVYQLVLKETPFYAESGGQVGDKGMIVSGDEVLRVLDTQKENELIIHKVDRLPSEPEIPVHARVNADLRLKIRNNHSATHLMHAALREVLGSHVEQRGSLVNEKLLRFDFSHFSKLSKEEIGEVERIVNAKIRENITLGEQRNVPIEEAKEAGAMALFGEKYGDHVRVITFDPEFSIELCGGTHVPSTGHIGSFRILSESSIAAGVRRIEAATGTEAEKFVNQQIALLEDVKEVLKDPADLKSTISNLMKEKAVLEKQLDKVYQQAANDLKNDLITSVEEINGVNAIIQKIDFPSSDKIKNLAFGIKNEIDNLFMVLAANVGGKPQITIVISDSLTNDRKLNAGEIVRKLATEIKGGGGGQPFYATAGGKDLEGLDKVIVKARELVK